MILCVLGVLVYLVTLIVIRLDGNDFNSLLIKTHMELYQSFQPNPEAFYYFLNFDLHNFIKLSI